MTRRPQHPYPLHDKQDFAAWRVQHRRAYHLLDTVVFAWRGSNASLRGFTGKWAAYSQAEWMEKSGLKKDAMKSEFSRLEIDGLIEREAGSWDGFKPRTFIRPTFAALTFMGVRPTDHGKLGRLRSMTMPPKGSPDDPPKVSPKGPPNGSPNTTSLPSSPSIPTKTTVHAHAQEHTGGEGKAGEDGKIKKKLVLKKPIPKTPISPPPDDDDMDAAFEAVKAKKLEKLLAAFPRIEGDHSVWHPADQHDGWAGWSLELKKERYAVYVAYVTKALKAKSAKTAKGKSSKGDSGFYTGKKPGGLFGLLKKT